MFWNKKTEGLGLDETMIELGREIERRFARSGSHSYTASLLHAWSETRALKKNRLPPCAFEPAKTDPHLARFSQAIQKLRGIAFRQVLIRGPM